jgi:hypothetical protein
MPPTTRRAKKLEEGMLQEPEAELCPGKPIDYLIFHGGRKYKAVEVQEESSTGPTGGKKLQFRWFDKLRLWIIAASNFGFRCILTMESGLHNHDLNFVHFVAKTTSPWIVSSSFSSESMTFEILTF